MGRLLVALGIVASAGTPVRADAGSRTTLELRISPPFVRTLGAPSLCPMVAIPVRGRFFVGGGYELVQDYDVSVQTSGDTAAGPMVLSGLRVGAWYRGGARRYGITFAAGPVVTGSHPTYSLARTPGEMDAGTYVLDLGIDVSAGYVWSRFRLEAYALPAWSFGRISSNATSRNDSFDELNLRVGLGLAWAI